MLCVSVRFDSEYLTSNENTAPLKDKVSTITASAVAAAASSPAPADVQFSSKYESKVMKAFLASSAAASNSPSKSAGVLSGR